MRLNALTAKHAGVIEVYDNAVSNTAQVMRYLEHHARWEEARIGPRDGERNRTHRSNMVTFINPFSLECHDTLRGFAKVVWHYLDDYAKRHDISFSSMENINVNRYFPGEFYKPHADDGPGQNRLISALVYLNDVQAGGETEFIYHDISVTPRAGRLIIFPSNYAYAHAAHPPTEGTKYSAAFWTTRP